MALAAPAGATELPEILRSCRYLGDGDIPAVPYAPAAPLVIHVDPAGDDADPGTDPAFPKKTLGGALDDAHLLPGGEIEIRLHGGVYLRPPEHEYRVIRRGNLLIAGAEGEEAVIRPSTWPGYPDSWGEGNLFQAEGPLENLTFRNLVLEGWQNPFYLGGGSGVLRDLAVVDVRAREFRRRPGGFQAEFFTSAYRLEDILGSPPVFVPDQAGLPYQIENLILSGLEVAGADLGVNIGDENDPNVKGLRITGCDFTFDTGGNDTAQDAVAVVNSFKVLIDNCRIRGTAGDGIDLKSADCSVVNTMITGATRNAVKFWRNGELINSIVYDCSPIDDGALIFAEGPGRIVHSLLGRKTPGYCATFAYGEGSARSLEIVNSVFLDLGHSFYAGTAALAVRNCLFHDMPGGLFSGAAAAGDPAALNALPGCGGNRAGDPLLLAPGAGDFAPAPGAPGVDSGSGELGPLPNFDFFGNPRPQGAAPEIGPREFDPAGAVRGRDFDGDRRDDFFSFRPASGLWRLRGLTLIRFGGSEDRQAPADYSGSGTAEIAVFRGRDGRWARRGISRFHFGQAPDIPLPGDYSGAGRAEAAVFRPGAALWLIRDSTRIRWGRAGDVPVPGAYSGNGTAAIAAFRPASGLWAIRGLTRAWFGAPADMPVPGDFRGEGKDIPAVYRPSAGLWSVRGLTRFYFGRPGDLPVVGDFAGSGSAQAGIYRPAAGLWFIRGLTRFHSPPGP